MWPIRRQRLFRLPGLIRPGGGLQQEVEVYRVVSPPTSQRPPASFVGNRIAMVRPRSLPARSFVFLAGCCPIRAPIVGEADGSKAPTSLPDCSNLSCGANWMTSCPSAYTGQS